jgi:hypothetical protein
VFPVRYDLGYFIPEDGILRSHGRKNLNSYIALTSWALGSLAETKCVSCEVRTGFLYPRRRNSSESQP